MSDQPEPLDAILAEMRAGIHTGRADIIDIVNERLIAYADRIEAAAERERIELREDEAKMLLREYAAAPDESLTPSALELKRELLRLAPATGNAAAMREALERIVGWCEGCHADTCETVCRPGLTSESIHAALAALAAPARNCDKFATADDARDAAKKEFANTMLLDDRQLRALVRWLFAPAEGGDHA